MSIWPLDIVGNILYRPPVIRARSSLPPQARFFDIVHSYGNAFRRPIPHGRGAASGAKVSGPMATITFITFVGSAARFGAPKIGKVTAKKAGRSINFVTFRHGFAGKLKDDDGNLQPYQIRQRRGLTFKEFRYG